MKHVYCILAGALAAIFLPVSGHAQTAARLKFTPQAGLSMTGAVGTVYAIQYATNLGPNTTWRCLNLYRPAMATSSIPNTLPAGPGARFYRAAAFSRTNMVFLSPGTFTMGSPNSDPDRFSDEGPQTSVTFTKGLLASVYLVTQQEYQSVVGSNPSSFTGDPKLPVDSVSWINASNYCRVLTQQEVAAGRIPAGCVFRLPTEAEWEYMCRAGTTNRFYFGDDIGFTLLPNYAWYDNDSGSQTRPVGQKPANPWGLYDTIGNLWEWCLDYYDTSYPGGSVTDPQGSNNTQYGRILRGGSWADDDAFCRSTCRIYDDPASGAYGSYGFRIVLAPGG